MPPSPGPRYESQNIFNHRISKSIFSRFLKLNCFIVSVILKCFSCHSVIGIPRSKQGRWRKNRGKEKKTLLFGKSWLNVHIQMAFEQLRHISVKRNSKHRHSVCFSNSFSSYVKLNIKNFIQKVMKIPADTTDYSFS